MRVQLSEFSKSRQGHHRSGECPSAGSNSAQESPNGTIYSKRCCGKVEYRSGRRHSEHVMSFQWQSNEISCLQVLQSHWVWVLGSLQSTVKYIILPLPRKTWLTSQTNVMDNPYTQLELLISQSLSQWCYEWGRLFFYLSREIHPDML